MLRETNNNIFQLCQQLLNDHHFSQSFKLAESAAKQYKLYNAYQKDFARVRVLAYEVRDFEQAAYVLSRTLARLSDEITVMEIETWQLF